VKIKTSKMHTHHVILRQNFKQSVEAKVRGKGREGETVVTTKKVRKWDEGTSGEVKE
jgi:hypothetical protein